jgi:hypothetical protein
LVYGKIGMKLTARVDPPAAAVLFIAEKCH